MNREQIREQVRTSRLAQGLPEHVEDARLLQELAAEVVVQAPEPVRVEHVRMDDREVA
jgi:hypothetical protein